MLSVLYKSEACYGANTNVGSNGVIFALEAHAVPARLLAAGIATELHVFGGSCPGFDSLLPDWPVSQQLFSLQGAALRRAFKKPDALDLREE